MKTLENKVSLVTGGSRGIGAAIAEKLAAEGSAVAITYAASADRAQAVADKIKAAGGRAIAIKADSADHAAVKAAVDETVKTFGRLDILVNNAGVATLGAFEDFKADDFQRLIDVNIKGVYAASQEAQRHMTDGGRIINIGSTMSSYAAFSGAAVYTMTKAAVAGFTKGLARDLAPRRITVNNVQPGPIDTDMNPADSEHAAALTALVPLGAYGAGADIAHAVAFLAGDGAAYITGAQLLVDGGFAA